MHCILGHFSTLLDVQALASIGQLTTLTELRIASCNKLTVNGTPHLAGLTRMQVTPLRSPALPLCCMQGRVVRCHGSSMVHRGWQVCRLFVLPSMHTGHLLRCPSATDVDKGHEDKS